jgi:hypothetical protein
MLRLVRARYAEKGVACASLELIPASAVAISVTASRSGTPVLNGWRGLMPMRTSPTTGTSSLWERLQCEAWNGASSSRC